MEQDFTALLGGDVYSIAVNSATAGMHLALEAMGVGPGDEVITTPYTFTSTAQVIHHLGAKPVFVDIDPESITIDPEKVEKTIKSRLTAVGRIPKVIMPVHIAGLASDMDLILEIASKYKMNVLEDAAHALPSTWKGQLIGTLPSDAVVFSFYANKTVTTGEGGMIVTRNRKIAQRCRIMRLHGINRDTHDRKKSCQNWYYEVVAPGYKYNMNDIAASIGIHQLKKIWQGHDQRRKIASIYDSLLSDLPVILPPHPRNGDIHAWHLYMLRLKQNAKITRDQFIEKMREKEIFCSVHFIPLHIHPFWCQLLNLKPMDYPDALSVYLSTVSLPIYERMSVEDSHRVALSIREVMELR
jgi:dTDP-4-amino-4,6-dideoxygalactose transaminase